MALYLIASDYIQENIDFFPHSVQSITFPLKSYKNNLSLTNTGHNTIHKQNTEMQVIVICMSLFSQILQLNILFMYTGKKRRRGIVKCSVANMSYTSRRRNHMSWSLSFQLHKTHNHTRVFFFAFFFMHKTRQSQAEGNKYKKIFRHLLHKLNI